MVFDGKNEHIYRKPWFLQVIAIKDEVLREIQVSSFPSNNSDRVERENWRKASQSGTDTTI